MRGLHGSSRGLKETTPLAMEDCVSMQRTGNQWVFVREEEARDDHLLNFNAGKAPVRDAVSFTLNGKPITVQQPDPKLLLADYLRDIGLTGTKIGCSEGGCGACTVLLDGDSHGSRHINACMRPLAAVDGLNVTTVEGVGCSSVGFGDVQKALADNNGSQCGYCSPGWVMAMESLLKTNPQATEAEIEAHFDGNICRCTGYRAILQGFRTLASDSVHAHAGSDQEGHVRALGLAGAKKKACAGVCGGGGCKDKNTQKQTQHCGTTEHFLQDIEDMSVCEIDAVGNTPSSTSQKHSHSTDSHGVLVVEKHGCTWVRVNQLDEAQKLLTANTHIAARLVVGNTSIGVTKYYTPGPLRQSRDAKLFVDVANIPELLNLREVSGSEKGGPGLHVGAAVTLNGLLQKCEALARQSDTNAHLQTIATHLKRVANNQVRNAGSWAGNVMMACHYPDFVSDVLVVLAGAGATVTIQSREQNSPGCVLRSLSGLLDWACATDKQKTTRRTISLVDINSHDFASNDIVVSCFIPQPTSIKQTGISQVYRTYKVASRKRNAHAAVNAAFNLSFTPSGVCVRALILFGGVCAHKGMWRAKGLEAYVCGKALCDDNTLQHALSVLTEDILRANTDMAKGSHTAEPQDEGKEEEEEEEEEDRFTCLSAVNAGKTRTRTRTRTERHAEKEKATAGGVKIEVDEAEGQYRPVGNGYIDIPYAQSLARSLLYKYVLSLQDNLSPRLRSAIEVTTRPLSKAAHTYPTPDKKEAPLSQPMPKLSSRSQASGELVYADDAGARYTSGALCAAFVYSTEAKATIKAIDASEALAMPGVVDVMGAEDLARLGCSNDIGMFPGDEELFAAREVKAVGQPIALVLADTYQYAREAVKKVAVKYQRDPKGPILGIKAAIEAKSYQGSAYGVQAPDDLKKGDVTLGFKHAYKIITGETFMKPQQHFQMETHSMVAIPEEAGRMTVLAACQGPTAMRKSVASVLKCSGNRINIVGKRMGGSFGGKISRATSTACAAAVAARKHGRAVRLQNDRNTDMTMHGNREAQLCRYKIGVDRDGKILAAQLETFMDGGYCYDSTLDSMLMCMMWQDNCYNFPNYFAQGKVMQTNVPTPTSMRSPGAMQGVMQMELILEHIAREMAIDDNLVRERNFLRIGDATPNGQIITDTGGGDFTLPKVWARVLEDSNYTQRKAEVETFNKHNRWRKRGLAIVPAKYGMTDAGVGTATKLDVMCEDGTVQVSTGGTEMGQGLYTKVAQAVASKLPLKVSDVIVTDSETSRVPNSAMTGGSASSECCVASALNACDTLLDNLAPYLKDNTVPWTDAVAAANAAGVNMSVTEFMQKPALPAPQMFNYYVYCAGVCEVELDVLTGETEIRRVDIAYDGGQSLNPEVDLGQIEGAFVMAAGLMLTEDYQRSSDGALFSNGTWEYKVPQSHDIPLEFNVRFLDHSIASQGIRGSKAVAEPPMQLGVGVLLAAKFAVYAAQQELIGSDGDIKHLRMDAPATISVLHKAVNIKQSDLRLN